MNWELTLQTLTEFAESSTEFIYVAALQALLIAIVIGAVLYLLRNRVSAQLKYALLLVVLVKFAIPPFWMGNSPVSLMAQPQIAKIVSPQYALQVIELTAVQDVNGSTPSASETVTTSKTSKSSDAIQIAANHHSDATTSERTSLSSWIPLVSFIYLVGVAFLLLRLAVCYFYIARRVRRATHISSGPIFDRFQNIGQHLGIGSGIRFGATRLRLSPECDSPFAIGVLRPTVVIPTDMVEADDETLNIVMAHELAHIKRHDITIGWLETILSILWWFHPAMYWLTRKIRQTREDCCDDLLLATQLAEADQYCQTLIGASPRQRQLVFEPVLAGFFGHEHAVARRIRRLMNESILRSKSLSNVSRGVFALACLTLLPGMQPHVPQSAPVTEIGIGSFDRWRNPSFRISEKEKEAVKRCEIHTRERRLNKTTKVIENFNFLAPEVEQDLLSIIKEHPKLFYAHHILGTWYRKTGNAALAKKHFDISFAEAPVVLVQNYRFVDGTPAANLKLELYGFSCYQVQGDNLTEVDLNYTYLKTDSEGNIRVPAYDTVCSGPGYSCPRGCSFADSDIPHHFQSTSPEGIMPPLMFLKNR